MPTPIRGLFALSLLLLLSLTTRAQDTLSFGGIYDLPGAEVRATPLPVSRLASQFTVEEVYRLPGTFYDPARLVALLPGVVQTNDQANHLSVRGNTPNANLWRLNGLAIVNPNHTANAGTFYDFPTLSGGGVNAISAQMLDNSGFFAGPLPLEYGYATGGTFDLRLRPGAKLGARQQVQAGFIGFDGMAEGPIGKSGQTSYLVNGRYSFTGLLADMGVDFGGEEIRFADMNAHLHHQWKGGEVSVFAIIGGSSNIFRGPDSTEVIIVEQKELFDIDFTSDLQVFGVSFNQEFPASSLSGGLGWSSISSDRSQAFSGGGPLASEQITDLQRVSANLKYNRILNANLEFEIGSELLSQDYSAFISLLGERSIIRSGNPRITSISPFAGFNFFIGKHTLRVGSRLSYFTGEDFDELAIEPRVSWTRVGKRSAINLDFSYTAQPVLQELVSSPFFEDRERVVPKGFNTSLKYSRKIGQVSTAITGFLQKRQLEYGVKRNPGSNVILIGAGFSMNNFLELDPFIVFDGYSTTTNYGVELEAAGGKRNEGLYYRGSLTWLRSKYNRTSSSTANSRYDIPYIFNLTVGKEWSGKDRKERSRTFGVNAAFIAHAGERSAQVPREAQSDDTVLRFFTGQNLTSGIRDSNGPYFRPDLRLYKTKVRAKTTTTLALDIQNVANIENVANVYYDAFLERPNERFQLGLIPVLSYRITWR